MGRHSMSAAAHQRAHREVKGHGVAGTEPRALMGEMQATQYTAAAGTTHAPHARHDTEADREKERASNRLDSAARRNNLGDLSGQDGNCRGYVTNLSRD